MVSLATGISGGLVRAGVPTPTDTSAWIGPAVAAHAFLMICTFMGTVIGIERAVAAKLSLAFLGPATSGLAGIALLAGWPTAAAWLVLGASIAFVGVNMLIVKRQTAAHTVLLLVGAIAWATGCVLHALGAQGGAVVPWWFAFLVLTIAAERLEMTRLMQRRRGSATALYLVFSLMFFGCAFAGLWPVAGGAAFGASLCMLAVWLLCFDIARRTVRAHGLSRYMAICLLLGYLWLLVAGSAWAATSLGWPLRDTALHALGLGFVFSMVLGHAPVILPAIARVKVLFGWAYYLPLSLLHGSLVVRLVGPWIDFHSVTWGAIGNAVAIGAFLATVAGSAAAWHFKHTTSRTSRHGLPAKH
ncbi:hypothetical protein CDN99_15255 [Roseateles aquatilis]|uniref:Uncharacterized protein n=2 Tax=Roseateles aquatilis TaxID=431061 RepID=A0A246J8L8_9BURK|nr:hypothetical protein [Burkholderiaceae bacterium]OWQ88977.1 hypothetical protein CDN99_15255 [Roseateles aquatilis]